ncbi:hypothetical protein C1646_754004 [Rhizophagus diaphanus]|nr:hypothetical protein C1646_754004 [Rhizophagus diaphanus] [Rhizophagus sp. MUCL 43196]
MTRHTATFIDNKLYILGYEDSDGKNFFYIDFSVSFNTQNLIVKDLSNINIVPENTLATSVKGGANNNTLFLYGGFNFSLTSVPLVYTFDAQTNLWNIPKIIGDHTSSLRKYHLTGIVDNKGKMYLWGGYGLTFTYNSDMLILDTVNLVWDTGSFAPIKCFRYTAILLPDNKIIYMNLEGLLRDNELPSDQVYIYDNWNMKLTTGTIPSYRGIFTAVLGIQRVIIYGGPSDAEPIDSSLYELKLINFEWRIPKTSGQTPASRISHSANVIDKYMVISFGYGYDRSIENDIYCLILVMSLRTLLGCLLLSFVSFIEYRRDENRSKDFDNDQAENNVHNYGQEIVQPPKNEKIFNHGQEIVEPPNNDHIFNHGQEIVELTNNDQIFNHGKEITQPHTPEPVINNNYNHEQESTQIANDKKLSLQYVLKLEQEIQDLKQMILQNNN